MKVTIIKECQYSSNGTNCVTLSVGETVDNLPKDIEAAFLLRGNIKAFSEAKKETKVVNPVLETKTAPKKKSTKVKK